MKLVKGLINAQMLKYTDYTESSNSDTGGIVAGSSGWWNWAGAGIRGGLYCEMIPFALAVWPNVEALKSMPAK